uniref:Uncharacterized protein n=1 Tax=viral metagenome TaxID=1070528 RepID=A0A6C0BX10_9ZZZZ
MTLTANDLVYARDNNNNITSAGFKIDSYLLQNGESAINVMNKNTGPQVGGGLPAVSSILNGLAVPAGLLYLQQNISTKNIDSKNEEVDPVQESLYNRLVSMVSEKTGMSKTKKSRPRKTRSSKNKLTNKNNTKRKNSSSRNNKTRRT